MADHVAVLQRLLTHDEIVGHSCLTQPMLTSSEREAVRAAIAALSQPVAEAADVMTGAAPDDLADFLEWVASQLLLRDTKAGTFAQGVAS